MKLNKLKRHYLLLIPLLVGLFTLFYGLGSHYQKLVSDEFSFLLNVDFLKGYPYYPYLILPQGIGTTHTLLPYLMQPAVTIFGYTTLGIRFVPALFGLLGIAVFYFLVYQITLSKKIAFLSAAVLAVTQWYLAMSRVAIEISEIIFFSLVNLLFLILFINSANNSSFTWRNLTVNKKYLFLLAAGLSFGLVQHTYQSARVYLLFYVLFFPLFWWLKKVPIKEMIVYLGFFGLGFLLTVSPLIYAYIDHPESFDSRRGELVFYQHLSVSDLLWSLKQSTLRTLAMFHLRGSDVSCYNIPGKPMLDSLSGLLMVTGMVLSLKRVSREINLVLYLFFGIALLPSILSYWPATPHGLRAAGSLIPTIFWVGLGLHETSRVFKKYGLLLLIIGLVLISYLNLKVYFIDQAALQNDCFRIDSRDFEERKKLFLEKTGGIKFIR